MASDGETADDGARGAATTPPAPGIAILVEAGKPNHRTTFYRDRPIRVGRGAQNGLILKDEAVSTAHAEITLGADGFYVRDLGSKNGTSADGVLLLKETSAGPVRVVRVGCTVLLPVADVWPFVDPGVGAPRERFVRTAMERAYLAIAEAARKGRTVLITGESGTGKEHGAGHYLSASGRSVFQVINCGAIPAQLAESLLFGHVKGAFSGAVADKVGIFGAANGGVLFLDEIGNLSLENQVKLLRAVETKEIFRVGSTRAEPVDVHICCATNADLELEAQRGTSRMDLYMRIGQVKAHLLPLRERPEEVPYFVDLIVAEAGVTAHATLYEKCLLRPYVGKNIRGLRIDVEAAIGKALSEGRRLVQGSDMPEVVKSEVPPALDPVASVNEITKPMLSKQERDLRDVERFYNALARLQNETDPVEKAAATVRRGRSWGYTVLAKFPRKGG